jgi:hypothetical protein
MKKEFVTRDTDSSGYDVVVNQQEVQRNRQAHYNGGNCGDIYRSG